MAKETEDMEKQGNPAEEPVPEQTKSSEKEELEKRVMQLRQKLQILEWDAERDQINPAKRFELEQLRKEFEEVKNKLREIESKEKPKKEKEPEPENEPDPEEPKESFTEKVKGAVDKVEKFLHLKKEDDENLFADEVEALEEAEEKPGEKPEENESEEKKETSQEPEEKAVEEEKKPETQSNES